MDEVCRGLHDHIYAGGWTLSVSKHVVEFLPMSRLIGPGVPGRFLSASAAGLIRDIYVTSDRFVRCHEFLQTPQLPVDVARQLLMAEISP